jgi:hypothetical protein
MDGWMDGLIIIGARDCYDGSWMEFWISSGIQIVDFDDGSMVT